MQKVMPCICACIIKFLNTCLSVSSRIVAIWRFTLRFILKFEPIVFFIVIPQNIVIQKNQRLVRNQCNHEDCIQYE